MRPPGDRSSARRMGNEAEDAALAFLKRNGLRLLQRNFLCPLGEIDLIMNEGNALVFVEVRYRRRDGFGSGAESVTKTKQQKLIRTAQVYLQQLQSSEWPECRFDVIEARAGTPFELNWIQDAFEA